MGELGVGSWELSVWCFCRFMNRLSSTTMAATALLIPALLTGGCATRLLWEERWHEPAWNPNLTLAIGAALAAVFLVALT